MTAKEKAKELFQKMMPDDNSTHPKIFGHAKQCALIAVDEILENVPTFYKAIEMYSEQTAKEKSFEYWLDVRHEIEKI